MALVSIPEDQTLISISYQVIEGNFKVLKKSPSGNKSYRYLLEIHSEVCATPPSSPRFKQMNADNGGGVKLRTISRPVGRKAFFKLLVPGWIEKRLQMFEQAYGGTILLIDAVHVTRFEDGSSEPIKRVFKRFYTREGKRRGLDMTNKHS